MGSIKDSRQIGERIRSRRKALAMTQEELGELAGVTYQQIQKYEKGASKLSPERLQRVAAALHVPLDYFFRDEKSGRLVSVREGLASYQREVAALSFEEKEFLRQFRRLDTPSSRALALSLLRSLVKHAPRAGALRVGQK
ncbi:MAG: helix-turn-helix transcriptional regulator [Nitrospirae bacterium]|nr:helix-turn-helix transcriptional regulator [Nitrospirota bacterium]